MGGISIWAGMGVQLREAWWSYLEAWEDGRWVTDVVNAGTVCCWLGFRGECSLLETFSGGDWTVYTNDTNKLKYNNIKITLVVHIALHSYSFCVLLFESHSLILSVDSVHHSQTSSISLTNNCIADIMGTDNLSCSWKCNWTSLDYFCTTEFYKALQKCYCQKKVIDLN
jgi:hypothetical protein